MSRILREIFCGHLPWKLKDENLRKFRQNFVAFFADLFEKFRKNFALGGCGHNILGLGGGEVPILFLWARGFF